MYKLTDREMGTLPFETRVNRHNVLRPMRLYSKTAVRDLARRKAEYIGIPFVADRDNSGAVAGVLPASNLKQPMSLWERAAILHDRPEPEPLIIHEYVSEDTSEPHPDAILWGGCHGIPRNVKAEDACLLYNVST